MAVGLRAVFSGVHKCVFNREKAMPGLEPCGFEGKVQGSKSVQRGVVKKTIYFFWATFRVVWGWAAVGTEAESIWDGYGRAARGAGDWVARVG